ncbi:MAG: hypothetical protein M1835_006693 [Candelina submexicana]|nr:MAG: hypothetical protein M1835_006693 [Candelina submexicana]
MEKLICPKELEKLNGRVELKSRKGAALGSAVVCEEVSMDSGDYNTNMTTTAESNRGRWNESNYSAEPAIVTGVRAGAYGAGNKEMEVLFNIHQSRFSWLFFGTTAWGVGGSFLPIFFILITDGLYRVRAYFVFYTIFLLCLIPCSLAQNFATLIISRIIGAGASVATVAILGGMLKDMWKDMKKRNVAMGLFGTAIVVGIALGPFIGATIERNLTWRWIYHIQLIFDSSCVPFFLLIIRETKTDFILAHQAKRKSGPDTRSFSTRWTARSRALVRAMIDSPKKPIHMTFTEPIVFLCFIWVGYAWGILFLLTQSVVRTFGKTYGFSLLASNTAFLAVGAGAILASFLQPLQDRLFLASASRNTENPGQPIHEARLYTSIPGQVLFAGGLFWYGWTSQSHIHWLVPVGGLGCIGFGICTTYVAVYHYCTESFPKHSAAANGATSFSRFIFCGFLGLAWNPMQRKMGIQWAASCLGFIGLVITLAPVIMLVKGDGMRRRSYYTLKTVKGETQSHVTTASYDSKETVVGVV